MYHGMYHDVPRDIKSASLEKFVPPWTVQRQVWSDSLTANNSGISTEVLLFGDINVSLTHHYRVHTRGLPHIAFRKDYLTRLRVVMSQVAGRSRRDMMSPVPTGPVSMRHVRSAELDSESPRKTQTCPLSDAASMRPRGIGRCRPADFDCSGCFGPAGCHVIQLSSSDVTCVSATRGYRAIASAPNSCFSQPGCASPGGLHGNRWCEPGKGSYSRSFGVALLVDPDTDLEDELPTPEGSMLLGDSNSEGVRLPGVSLTPPDLEDLVFEEELLSVSVLPDMVTPVVEPVEVFPVAPSAYPEPPVPVPVPGRRSRWYVAGLSTLGSSRRPDP